MRRRSHFTDPDFRITDVLQPGATLLQRLRHGLHIQVATAERRGLRDAMCRQVPQEFGEAGRAIPGAECAHGTAGQYGEVGGVRSWSCEMYSSWDEDLEEL